jgi:hypothetical protein
VVVGEHAGDVEAFHRDPVDASMTLLCRVKWFGRRFGGVVASLEEAKQLAGDDSLKAAFGLSQRLAFGEAAFDVGAGGGIDAAAGQHDGVESPIELAVAAAVEAVMVSVSR